MAWFDYLQGIGNAAAQGTQNLRAIQQQRQQQQQQAQELRRAKLGEFLAQLETQDPFNVAQDLATQYPEFARTYLRKGEQGLERVMSPLDRATLETKRLENELAQTTVRRTQASMEALADPDFASRSATERARVLSTLKVPMEQWGPFFKPEEMTSIATAGPDFLKAQRLEQIRAEARLKAAGVQAGAQTARDRARDLRALAAEQRRMEQQRKTARTAHVAAEWRRQQRELASGRMLPEEARTMAELGAEYDEIAPNPNNMLAQLTGLAGGSTSVGMAGAASAAPSAAGAPRFRITEKK